MMENSHKIKPELPPDELRDVIDLALWAGQLLLQNGAETARVEETVHRLGTGLGCSWLDILVSPNAIVATTISGEAFRTKVRRVIRFGGVNLTAVAVVNRLSRQVNRGELDRFGVRVALEEISSRPHAYPRFLVAILVGLACAAFSRIFGGDWPVFAVTWLAAATAMFVRQEMNHRHVNALLNVVLTAFVAGLIASSATLFQISPDPQIALAASVLLLVPGVQLVNASEDLLKGHTVTGIIRGINGGLISLGIALGIALVLSLPGVQGLWQGNITRQPQPVWLDALWSGAAALGFALLFNVPPRTLWACVLCGATGHAVRTALINPNGPIIESLEIATFISALVVGFMGELLARRLRIPTPTFTICGVIPMVPGTFAYGAMISMLQVAGVLTVAIPSSDLLQPMVTNFIKTGLILGALAAGIAMPSLFFLRYKKD
jgi:uncharacterized membrane protein YjjP (DUF1212 family)